MSASIAPLRGVHDVLPEHMPQWHALERTVREAMRAYGYQEFRVPIIEQTQLFKRSIGDFTDVVEKEMFTFVDQGEESITLRPEATAGIVRAMISNGLLRESRLRVWCMGPMFRRERPQAGRFRQFHQIDVECFGFPGPDVDAEVIALSASIFRRLGIGGLKLQLNSLGTPAVRELYRARLREYFTAHASSLDADSTRRLQGNPLRILDSKHPQMQNLIDSAPRMTDALDAASQAHFDGLCRHLRALGIDFEINPRLVRGLDYYTHTVFEWVTDRLGSQSAVCAGGRYDGLVAQLGGADTPGIGWAMGAERVILLLDQIAGERRRECPQVYIVAGEAESARVTALALAESLRTQWPELSVQTHLGGGSFKSQFKRADKSGAELALIVGDEEVADGRVSLKWLRQELPQERCAAADVSERIVRMLGQTRG